MFGGARHLYVYHFSCTQNTCLAFRVSAFMYRNLILLRKKCHVILIYFWCEGPSAETWHQLPNKIKIGALTKSSFI